MADESIYSSIVYTYTRRVHDARALGCSSVGPDQHMRWVEQSTKEIPQSIPPALPYVNFQYLSSRPAPPQQQCISQPPLSCSPAVSLPVSSRYLQDFRPHRPDCTEINVDFAIPICDSAHSQIGIIIALHAIQPVLLSGLFHT